MKESVLFARQPIFDAASRLYAHEILYRSEASLETAGCNASTRELLVNLCTNLLNDNVNLGLPMFVNVDEEFLLADDFFPVAPQNLIFEILETVRPTPAVLEKINQYRVAGYEFALDDYVLEKSKVQYFNYLKIIKIDLLQVNFERLIKVMPVLKKTGCKLLAEKVEDQEMFDKCLKLGFDLFQGYFLERPSLIKGKKIVANQQAVLHLLAELARDDIEVDEVAELISQDVGLTVKILSLINCPLYQLVREVKSVKDAVVILGLTTVKQWAITLALVSESSRPIELYRVVLVRAKTLALYCDVWETNSRNINSSSCFLLGLLSGVDAIFEVEMEEILNHLKLDSDIKAALLHDDNSLGELLKNSIGIERFDSHIFEQLSQHQICLFNGCYREALKWADGVMSYLES